MVSPVTNRPRKTLPPDVIKQWRRGLLEESKMRPSGRPSSYTALTDSEIHHRVVKWLYYMCGYRSNRVASELHGVSRVAVWYWLRGRHTPRPTNLARLCRDAGWRVRQGVHLVHRAADLMSDRPLNSPPLKNRSRT